MEALKTWGISTCTVLIVASLASMIVPNISEKNIMRVLISVFILTGILYPFTKILNSNDFNLNAVFSSKISQQEYEEIEYSEKLINNLEECAVNALYPIINDTMEKHNAQQFGINVALEAKKDGVEIKCVNITVYEPHINSIDVISNELKDELGLDVNVKIVEGS